MYRARKNHHRALGKGVGEVYEVNVFIFERHEQIILQEC